MCSFQVGNCWPVVFVEAPKQSCSLGVSIEHFPKVNLRCEIQWKYDIQCTKGAISSILGHPTWRTADTFVADRMNSNFSWPYFCHTNPPKKVLLPLPLCNHTLWTRWTLLLGLVHNLHSLCSSHAVAAAYLPGWDALNKASQNGPCPASRLWLPSRKPLPMPRKRTWKPWVLEQLQPDSFEA